MAVEKLKEELELKEEQEENHSLVRKFKEESDHTGVQRLEDTCSVLDIKDEPEEVGIKPETHENCPYSGVIVKSEDEEEVTVGAGSEKHPAREEHGENSSDTDDSEDWTASVKRPTPQSYSERTREEAGSAEECCSSDSEWSWEFNPPTKTPARSKRQMEDYPDGTPQNQGHKCTECGKVFHYSDRLRKHQLNKHQLVQRQKCPVCAKEFTETRLLRSHMRTHTGEKPFKCSVCSKQFASNHLKDHMRIHTGEKPFRCSVCQRKFRIKSELKRHMKIHTFSCSTCGKHAATEKQLQHHMRTHTEDRPFVCGVCSKSYKSRSNLKTHMSTHTGERPFTCSVCNKGFLLKAYLKAHMSTHTQEKPFRCSICAKGFTNKHNLNKHVKAHSEEEPFQ